MATRKEILAEIQRRGLNKSITSPLTEEQILALAIDGKIDNNVALLAIQEVRSGKQIDLINGEIRRVDQPQKFEQLPAQAGMFGSLAAGAEFGGKEIGAGVLQIAGRIGDAIGIEGSKSLQEGVTRVIGQEQQRFDSATEKTPIAGGIGRALGQVAVLPLGGATIPRAIGAGLVGGALQPTKQGGLEGDLARGTAAAIGGGFGGLFQAAIPLAVILVRGGFNKSKAITSAVFEKLRGKPPAASAFDADGNPTPEFVKALNEAGISTNDLDNLVNAVDEQSAKTVEALGGRFEAATNEGLNQQQSARLAEFDAVDVPASTGQVTRDFGTAQSEDVARSAVSEAGTEARSFFAAQQEKLVSAANKFSRAIGAAKGASNQERGAAIQNSLIGARKESKEQVTALYDRAKELAGNDTPIEGVNLEDVFTTAIDELPVDDVVSSSIERALAKFGVIQGTVEKKGINTIVTRPDGSKISFKGNQQDLNLGNAEELRKRLNGISTNNASASSVIVAMKNTLDGLVDDALGLATTGDQAAQTAVVTARNAFKESKRTFDAADIVGRLVGVNKKDRTTPLIDASTVVETIIKSKNKLENIQRIKSALTRSKSNLGKGEAAIKELQRGFVDTIFGKAISETPDGFVMSGAKLNSEFARLGEDAMKELFPPELFTQFMLLRRVIGNATIPVPRTTNPSGSGSRILNAIIKISGVVEGLPGIGQVGRFGFSALRRTIDKTVATEREDAALAGIRASRPESTKITPKTINDERALARFIGLYTSPPLRQGAIIETTNIGDQNG